MKGKLKTVSIIIGLTLILCNWSYSYWATKLDYEVKISTDSYYVGEIEYENFNIKARMIREVQTNQIGYCLEIDKSYPSGETFNENGAEDIDSIPGNGADNEDDLGTADIVISVETGGSLVSGAVFVVFVIVALVGVYIFKKNVIERMRRW